MTEWCLDEKIMWLAFPYLMYCTKSSPPPSVYCTKPSPPPRCTAWNRPSSLGVLYETVPPLGVLQETAPPLGVLHENALPLGVLHETVVKVKRRKGKENETFFQKLRNKYLIRSQEDWSSNSQKVFNRILKVFLLF